MFFPPMRKARLLGVYIPSGLSLEQRRDLLHFACTLNRRHPGSHIASLCAISLSRRVPNEVPGNRFRPLVRKKTKSPDLSCSSAILNPSWRL